MKAVPPIPPRLASGVPGVAANDYGPAKDLVNPKDLKRPIRPICVLLGLNDDVKVILLEFKVFASAFE